MMISQSSSEHSICMVLRTGDANRAVEAIEREFRLERERNLIEEVGLTRNVSIVSIIGAGMHGTPGISGKFFEALGKHRTNVLAIAQGSSELNISAVILERDYKQAVQAIHTAFGLTNDLHVFVFGCGNIGRMLLKQIHENREHLSRGSKINLKVLGVSDSRHWRFVPAGLTGAELKLLGLGKPLQELAGSDKRPSTDEIFRQIAGTYKSDIVIVDATAAELAPTHIEGLRRGFHVVTANKKPLTSRLGEYQEIQRLRRRKGLNYQYEATFGAGLPLLYTLQDLINTGDKILRIQGCLSGTLGILCSRMDEGVPFSRAVSEAMALGYTEPDPRDDLSGIDVARKALIIARELGRSLELSQIRLTAMLPRKFFKLKTVALFLARLTEADKKMAQAVQKAHAPGKSSALYRRHKPGRLRGRTSKHSSRYAHRAPLRPRQYSGLPDDALFRASSGDSRTRGGCGGHGGGCAERHPQDCQIDLIRLLDSTKSIYILYFPRSSGFKFSSHCLMSSGELRSAVKAEGVVLLDFEITSSVTKMGESVRRASAMASDGRESTVMVLPSTLRKMSA